MSYYAVLDNAQETGGDVASAGGWHDFTRWVEQLEGADELRHLVEHGWSDDLAALADQLKQAIEGGEPEEAERHTAEALLAVLAETGDAEVISVTDGVVEAGSQPVVEGRRRPAWLQRWEGYP